MAQNYIQPGEVIRLTADASHMSGCPYRVSGFNGVALATVVSGEQLSLQLEGVFEFPLARVSVGNLIYIDAANGLTLAANGGTRLFGRAVTASDANNKFYCRLLQS